MTDTESLRARLTEDLTEGLTVSVVAVLMALLALFASYEIGFSVIETGGLLIAIAVMLPTVYEEVWPITYPNGAAAVWTVSACLVTIGTFVGAYQLAGSSVSTQYAGGIAFVVTVIVQYGCATAFGRLHRSA